MKENKIISLSVNGVGLFDDLNITFNDQFNYIVGPNGSGKTTILKSIALILTPSNAREARCAGDSELWVDCRIDSIDHRVGLGKGWVRNGEQYRMSSHQQWQLPQQAEDKETCTISQINDSNKTFAPLILGAYRRIEYKNIQGMVKKVEVKNSITQYQNNSIKSIYGGELPNVKQWLINRYFVIEKPWAEVYRDNWEWLIDNISEIAPEGIEFEFKEIRENLEPVFIQNEKECYLEELSAGFQAVLSLVLSIFEWIEAIHKMEEASVKDATGTVIIDELDVHLHPEWQLKIGEMLKKIFPHIQFIATTHSPHIIASALPGELLIIPDNNGTVEIKPSDKSYSGWNTDQILEEVMGVKNLASKKYGELINKALVSIDERNTEKLIDDIKKLEEVAHPSDTVVSVLKIKLAELQLEV